MIFKIPQIISYISTYFTLEHGDLILTGTPSGVSGVRNGDIIEAWLSENNKIVAEIKYPVVQENYN